MQKSSLLKFLPQKLQYIQSSFDGKKKKSVQNICHSHEIQAQVNSHLLKPFSPFC